MAQLDRPIIEQTFFNQAVAVGIAPTPLASQLKATSMITAFILCNPTGNPSVFIGDQNVTVTTGIELLVSTSVQFKIQQERQLYELQDPELLSAQVALCRSIPGIEIPVIVWNPSNIYLISTAPVTIAAMLFRNVYV